MRKDGFTGEIALALRNAPRGLHPQRRHAGRAGPGAAHADRLAARPEDPVNLVLEGRATIEGREVVRPAVPAEDMMQAFFYRHLVPAQELKVMVGK